MSLSIDKHSQEDQKKAEREELEALIHKFGLIDPDYLKLHFPDLFYKFTEIATWM